MRERLLTLKPDERAKRSARIINALVALPQWQKAETVMLFAAMRDEPDLDQLWREGHLSDKRCLFPRIEDDDLQIYVVPNLGALRAKRHLHREPSGHDLVKVDFAECELALVPGLAFDSTGKRLGRGGGYYDRLLASTAPGQPLRIGVAFDFQIVHDLPATELDARMDIMLTDRAV